MLVFVVLLELEVVENTVKVLDIWISGLRDIYGLFSGVVGAFSLSHLLGNLGLLQKCLPESLLSHQSNFSMRRDCIMKYKNNNFPKVQLFNALFFGCLKCAVSP